MNKRKEITSKALSISITLLQLLIYIGMLIVGIGGVFYYVRREYGFVFAMVALVVFNAFLISTNYYKEIGDLFEQLIRQFRLRI